MSDETREIRVRTTWHGESVIEIPADAPRIDESNLDAVLEIEDVDAGGASLVDWTIVDPGPKVSA